MICKNCRVELTSDSKYCHKCGMPVLGQKKEQGQMSTVAGKKSRTKNSLEFSEELIEPLKGSSHFMFSGTGCLKVIGAFIGIVVLISFFMPDNSNETTQTSARVSTDEEWYLGGSLHKERVSDWRIATDKNKLATCADFVAATNKNISLEDLLLKSIELKTCIDTAIVGVEMINDSRVDELAALCMVTLGHK